jgi:two-component system, NarL family, response regulator YdfI
MIHVLVEPSSPDLQAEIADLLRDRSGIRLQENSESAGESSSGEGRPQPDVVIVAEASDPGLDWGEWSVAEVPIILLTGNPPGGEERWGADELQNWGGQGFPEGVHAILPRNVTRAELIAAIEAVAAGLFVFHPAEADLLPALHPRDSDAGASPSPGFSTVPSLNGQLVEQLTRREVEVLQLLAVGLGNKEIASRLEISEHTAKFHVASIMAKLGAATRTEAVTLGIRRGLVLI